MNKKVRNELKINSKYKPSGYIFGGLTFESKLMSHLFRGHYIQNFTLFQNHRTILGKNNLLSNSSSCCKTSKAVAPAIIFHQVSN